MAALPPSNFASASPKVSPHASPFKLKTPPPSTLTILELGPQATNFQLRVLVDLVADLREFGNGRGSLLRVHLSDDYGLLSLPMNPVSHVHTASISGVAFNMVAKFLAKTLEVGQVCSLLLVFSCFSLCFRHTC